MNDPDQVCREFHDILLMKINLFDHTIILTIENDAQYVCELPLY